MNVMVEKKEELLPVVLRQDIWSKQLKYPKSATVALEWYPVGGNGEKVCIF